jgi:hypothetical protein
MLAGIHVIEDVNRQYRRAAIRCSIERGIVGKPQVLAKPDNNRRIVL